MRLRAGVAFGAGLMFFVLAGCERHSDSGTTMTAPPVASQPAAPAVPTQNVAAAPESSLQIKRGFVTPVSNELHFESCTGAIQLLQGEGLKEIFQPLLTASNGKRLFVELRGDVVDKKTDSDVATPALIVQELLYATSDAPPTRCDAATRDYQVLIRGSTPAWSIKVRAKTMTYAPAQGSAQEFSLADSTDAEGAVVYRGTLDAHKLEITLTQQSCIDAATGDYYGFSARLILDQKTLQGCALPGE